MKLHAHVQCFDMNAEYMNPLYECCQINKKPIVIHAGREPKSTAYSCDPYQLCSAERLEHILIDFPNIPYAWDREIKVLKTDEITHEALENIAYKNAVDFFSLKLQAVDSV